MSEEEGIQVPAPLRPTTSDPEAWKVYWKAQGQPWRTAPEIDAERQKYLAERRSIMPDIEKGIYPFKDIKLGRADVEWLLVTHEKGRGPVDWNDESQRGRAGVDLRGAYLSQEYLSDLPLACMQGGLTFLDWELATEEQRNMAAVRMEQADLNEAQLQGANLGGAQLQQADLNEAQLQGANLGGAQLQQAFLRMAQLQGAFLGEAQLQGAHLRGSDLDGATLDAVKLSDEIYGSVRLADVRWGDVNLTVVDWEHVTRLGDEQRAHQKEDSQGKVKTKRMRLGEYKAAVRANRQLAVVLRDQGLNEEADRFAYRAQLLQRVVWRRQRRLLKYTLSWFLSLIAGYGYRPIRTVIWYLVVVVGFAITYLAVGHVPLVPDALVFSLTSFHGRGFFPGLGNEATLHNPLVVLASIEAVVGLFIEISFIATFTQRFFGK